MKVFNPTTQDITVSIKGVKYTAPAGGFAEGVKPEHAQRWKMLIHNFVELSADDSVEAPEVVEETVEETTEEVVEENETEEEVEISESLSRAELDALAEAREIDPSQFSNKASLVEALNS